MAVYRNLDQLASFKALQTQKSRITKGFLKTNLNADRVKEYQNTYVIGTDKLYFNYSAKMVDQEILKNLQGLCYDGELIAKFQELVSGAVINTGEKRMVLHHLTRGQLGSKVVYEDRDLRSFYEEQRIRFSAFAEKVQDGTIRGSTGKSFKTAVQVGIGGSDLGPRALFLAIRGSVPQKLEARFMSNVDPDDPSETLSGLDAETSLFVLVSKSGTTQETLTNEEFVIQFLKKKGIANPKKHIVCVTSETSPLAKSKDYLDSFFIDDFIGGRFSSTSAVGGVILSLAFGPKVFAQVLEGAHAVDQQSLETSISKNPAMLDAVLGIFERNILEFPSTAILPYSQALSRFPAHLQQADMESNGKSVNRDGQAISYSTGPVLFGEPGTNGQHSFYQLLHQGTDVIPLQFIGFLESQRDDDVQFQGSSSQKKLNANLCAQIIAFAQGKTDSNPNKHFSGERPSSLLFAKKLSPAMVGALLAHFENKIMFQGFLWNLNSFDQEGVQLGKILTNQVLSGQTDGALSAFAKLLNI